MRSAIEVEEQRGVFHIPNAPGLRGAPPQTLCGWTDVEQRYTFAVINCSECLRVLRYCKRVKLNYTLAQDPMADRVPDREMPWGDGGALMRREVEE